MKEYISNYDDGDYDFIPEAMKNDDNVIRFENGSTITVGELKQMHHIEKMTVTKIAEQFNISIGTLTYYMRSRGIEIIKHSKAIKSKRPRNSVYKNPKGLYPLISLEADNRSSIPMHRYQMEQHLGRKLTSTEVVHHIDFNKDNFKIDNLYLCKSIKHHSNIHKSLYRCAKDLFDIGVIMFDNEYFINYSKLEESIVDKNFGKYSYKYK